MAETGSSYGLGELSASGTVKAPVLPYTPADPISYRPGIALIGCGGITVHHLAAYRAAGYRVAGFYDVDPTRAKARREEFFPEARLYGSFDEALRDDSVEVLDIATHPEARYPLMAMAVEAGKHILSQKPFVVDLDEGLRLADRADSRGVKIAVNHNGRWAPHFSYISRAIAAGLVGEVSACHFSVSWNHGWIVGTPFEDIRYLVLYDFGIHWFDILSVFAGERKPLRVFASTAFSRNQKAKPPFLSQASVEYEGMQASIGFQADTLYGPEDRTEVAGTKGCIRSVGPDLNDQRVRLVTEAGTAEPELKGTWFPDGFHGTMGELLRSIEEKREPSNGARSAIRGLELCFAALASASSGEPVKPGSARKLIS
jgi:predicted dehydrogenase